MTTTELLDQALARTYGPLNPPGPGEVDVLLEMSDELWDQISRAAEMDDMTVGEFLRLHAWAVSKEQLHRADQQKRQAAMPKPDGRLRFPGGIR